MTNMLLSLSQPWLPHGRPLFTLHTQLSPLSHWTPPWRGSQAIGTAGLEGCK